MSNIQIAIRYAEALIEEAEELKALKEVGADLEAILGVIKQSIEFRNFLKSPVIKSEKKQQMFELAFGKSVHPLTLKFLRLLSQKERERDLLSIIEMFFTLQEAALGIIRVDIESSIKLSDQQIAQLKSKFESYLKKQVRIEMKIDPHLIGGFVARVGDTMFDGSIRHQLELLQQHLKELPVNM